MANHHFIKVSAVEYLDGYRLKVSFDDGAIKIVDFKDELWGEICEPLKDIEFFKQVSINPDFKVLCWPNGADFANDTIYDMGIMICKNTSSRQSRHSKEFLQIIEGTAKNSAIRAITHAKPLLVYWVAPDGEIIDAGNEHFANPPKGDKSVLSSPTNKGHLRGRAAFIGAVIYITVYGDKDHDTLSTKQMQLLKSAASKILSKLKVKGVPDKDVASAHFIQEDGKEIRLLK